MKPQAAGTLQPSEALWSQIRSEYTAGQSTTALAQKHGIPRSTIWSRARREAWLAAAPPPDYTAPFSVKEATVFDADVRRFYDWLGRTEASPFAARETGPDHRSEAILVITDVHIPFHNEALLRQSVEEFLAEHGTGILVIGGDFLDGYSLNSYGKFKESSLKSEMREGRKWLEWFSSVFEKVYLIKDNHLHGRYERWIAKNVPADMQDLLRHPYDVIVSGLPNVEHVQRTYKNGMSLGWFVVIGDALIAHAETHSGVAMKPVHTLSQWVDTWSRPLGLPEIRVCIEAHVHKLGSYYLPGKDRLLMESGCLVSWEGVSYSAGPEVKYKPIVNGCIHLVQTNGRTDFNRSRLVHLEP